MLMMLVYAPCTSIISTIGTPFWVVCARTRENKTLTRIPGNKSMFLFIHFSGSGASANPGWACSHIIAGWAEKRALAARPDSLFSAILVCS